ncbi:MAG: hotdog domain-containing protein [Candidatus Acidiferrales bacterium]
MKRSRKTAKRRTSMKRPKSSKPSLPPDERKPRIGLESAIERVVPHGWTIAAWDPSLPAVLSTPAMIGMMEIAAAESVKPDLPPGAITVGTRIEVDHLKAVLEGATVRATARLVKHHDRFLVFEVEARSGENVLGRGRVFRAIVEPNKFNSQAQSRKES